jgi:uncharacterized membrane protein
VRSREREYLWFGVAMAVSFVNDSLTTYRVFHVSAVIPLNLVQAILSYAILFALVGFYRRLMGWGVDGFTGA